MLPREAANIHPEKHNILVFLSNTLFPPFYIEDLSNNYRRHIEESMCQLFYPPPYGLSVAPIN